MGRGVTPVESFMEVCSVTRKVLEQWLRPQTDWPKVSEESRSGLVGAMTSADEERQHRGYSAPQPVS